MRAKQIAVRAALVCGAAGIVCALWSATDDSAANAADHRPASIEALPDQAADRAREAIDQVVPVPEPQREERADPPPAAPKPPTPEPTEPPTDPIIEVPPTEAPPVVVEAPPAADPVVVVTPPANEPTPTEPALADPIVITLPDGEASPDIPAPTVPRLPLPTPPVGAQVPIGPVPAATPLAAVRHDHPAPEAGHIEVAVCDDDTKADPLDMAAPTQRAARTHPRAAHLAPPGRTPCDPDGGDLTAHLHALAALSQGGGDQLAATLPAATVYPALRLLRELRPRGDLPATRSLHIEPRPA